MRTYFQALCGFLQTLVGGKHFSLLGWLLGAHLVQIAFCPLQVLALGDEFFLSLVFEVAVNSLKVVKSAESMLKFVCWNLTCQRGELFLCRELVGSVIGKLLAGEAVERQAFLILGEEVPRMIGEKCNDEHNEDNS